MNIRPKKQFINSTRALIHESTESGTAEVAGLTIGTDPDVFNPKLFFSSEWFSLRVSMLVRGEETLIEVGCGTGAVSVRTALDNPNLHVHATDINAKAKALTQRNTAKYAVDARVTAYEGDVLDSVPHTIKADSIFWSMPFGYLEPETILRGRDAQAFDPGYRSIRKFFSTAPAHLKSDGRLLIGFSSDIGHLELLEEIAKQNGFSLKLLEQTKGIEKDPVSMEIYEAKFKNNPQIH